MVKVRPKNAKQAEDGEKINKEKHRHQQPPVGGCVVLTGATYKGIRERRGLDRQPDK